MAIKVYRDLDYDALLRVWREEELKRVLNSPTIALHNTFTPSVTAFLFKHATRNAQRSHGYAAQDTNITFPVIDGITNTLVLSVQLQESGGADGAATDDYQLQYSRNSGAYTDVNASSSYVKAANETYSTSLPMASSTSSIFNIYGGTASSGETDQAQGQSFTTSGAFSAKHISLYFRKNGSPTDSLTVTIEDALSGGSVLVSRTVAASHMSTSGRDFTIEIPTTSLAAATTYYLKITRTGARDLTNYWIAYGSTGTSYSGGQRLSKDNNSWTGTGTTDDLLGVLSNAVTGLDAEQASVNDNIITDGTGTYLNGWMEVGDGQVTNFALLASRFTNHYFYISLVYADLANGDTLDFRVTLNGGTPGMTNSVTPRITVSKAAAYSVTPGAGSASVTGYAPTVDVPVQYEITPSSGAASVTGFAPTTNLTFAYEATPSVGAVTATGYAPSPSIGYNSEPGAGSATVTGHAPSLTGEIAVSPNTGAVTYTGLAPTVTEEITVEIGQSNPATITGYAPTVAVAIEYSTNPGVGSASITGYAPSLTEDISVTTGVGSATITGFAPTVVKTDTFNVTPAAGSVVSTGYAPSVSVETAGAVTPPVGSVTITGHAPTLAENIVVFPDRGLGTFQGRAPTVSLSSDVVEPTKPAGGGRGRRRKPVMYRGNLYRSEDELKLALAIQEQIDEKAEEIAPKPKKKRKKAKPATVVVESGEVKLEIPQVVFQSNALDEIISQIDSFAPTFRDLAVAVMELKRLRDEQEEEDVISMILEYEQVRMSSLADAFAGLLESRKNKAA